MLIVAALLLAALLRGRDPWFDESALIGNLLAEGPGSWFSPMPYFEQATPLAHRILGEALAQPLDEHLGPHAAVFALRGLSAAAALLLAWWLFRTVRLFGEAWEAAAAVMMVTASSFAIRYATEVKHYAFEAAASAAVLLAGALVSRAPRNPAALGLLLLAALLGYAFSFTLLLVVAALSVGLVASTLLEEGPGAGRGARGKLAAADLMRRAWSHRPLLEACLLACLGGLAFYDVYSRPVTRFQFAANPDRYGAPDLAGTPLHGLLEAPVLLLRHLYATLAPMQGWRIFDHGIVGQGLLAGFAAVLLAATCLAARRSPLLALTAASLFAILVLLHMAGIFPFTWDRQFYFALPIFAAVLALGGGEGLRILRSMTPRPLANGLAPGCFAALSALYVAAGLQASQSPGQEQISPLLERIADVSPATPVWVYYGAQPAFDVLARPGTTELGRLDHDSSVQGWEVTSGARNPQNLRATDDGYVTSSVSLIARQGDVWLLFAHDRRTDRAQIMAALAAAGQRCDAEAQAVGAHLYRCGKGQGSLP